MSILSQAQLIEALGGDAETARLLPDRATGGIDLVRLQGAIDDAEGDIEAAVGSRYLSMSANPSKKMTRIARQLAVGYAWGRTGNKVRPDSVAQGFGIAKQDLRDIENSASKPGENATLRFGSALDNSNGGRRCTYATMRHAGILGRR